MGKWKVPLASGEVRLSVRQYASLKSVNSCSSELRWLRSSQYLCAWKEFRRNFSFFPYNRFYTSSVGDQKPTLSNTAAFACSEKHPKAIHHDCRANASVCARAFSPLSDKLVEENKFLSPPPLLTVLGRQNARSWESRWLKLIAAETWHTRVFGGAN